MIKHDVCAAMLDSPVRKICARVELYSGSTLLQIFKHTDALKSFSIERVGEESKFFGFGICHRLNVHLLDPERAINITTANTLEVECGVNCDFIYPYPLFYVTEVNRDETTNELSITAYDALNLAAAHTVAEVGMAGYTIREFAARCAAIIGLPLVIEGMEDTSVFDTLYMGGANFEGTETIREALTAVAEATQTIYYINHLWELTFKRLSVGAEAVFTIDREKYFNLDSKTNRRLSAVCHATELGDNVTASAAERGTTQYVRDNPFWTLQDNIGGIVDAALAAVGGMTINQFTCTWRGNFLLELGDQIALVNKDGSTAHSYVINDVISYDGTMTQETQWSYTADDSESASNPSTLGDALKQTYARVDKANREIALVASATEANKESISALKLDTDGISASVRQVESSLSEGLENVNGGLAALTKQVEAKVSAEDVSIQIQSELANGVDTVRTTTGFTFNDEGLTVSKSGSEMSTQITEDGMQVFRDQTAVLTANNEGVDATNLHATTYLIVGSTSRFENFGSDRTGCFWIGG